MSARVSACKVLFSAAVYCWALGLVLGHSTADAQDYSVRPVAEKKIKQLPGWDPDRVSAQALYWQVENFSSLAEAKAAETPTSLVAELAGKVWLFTLGPKDGSTPGATHVAEIGPVPPLAASEYLLRINHGSGPPGAKTPVHTHPGSEAFYVVSGRLGQRTPHGIAHVEAGHSMNGHPADMPMEVFNAGTTDLTALIMFVVDAARPFSSPAKLE